MQTLLSDEAELHDDGSVATKAAALAMDFASFEVALLRLCLAQQGLSDVCGAWPSVDDDVVEDYFSLNLRPTNVAAHRRTRDDLQAAAAEPELICHN